MQVDRAMRLIAVEVQGDGHHCAVHPQEGHEHVLPGAEVGQTVVVRIDEIHHSSVRRAARLET